MLWVFTIRILLDIKKYFNYIESLKSSFCDTTRNLVATLKDRWRYMFNDSFKRYPYNLLAVTFQDRALHY